MPFLRPRCLNLGSGCKRHGLPSITDDSVRSAMQKSFPGWNEVVQVIKIRRKVGKVFYSVPVNQNESN